MVQTLPISDSELMRLSAMNPTLRFERNADGSLVTMPPTGGISGNRKAKAILRLGMWVEANDAGDFFSSATGFKLPVFHFKNAISHVQDAVVVGHHQNHAALLAGEFLH